MNTKPKHQTVFGLIVVLILILGAAACQPDDLNPKAWIDFPINGMDVSLNQQVEIISHGYAQDGVAYQQLSVNGVVYQQQPPREPNAQSSSFSFLWIPEQSTTTSLKIITVDLNGVESAPAIVSVNVSAKTSVVEENSPNQIETTEVPLTENNPTTTASVTLTSTPTLQPSPTFTPIPQVVIDFRSDLVNLTKGECANLSWNVQYADTVNLDGTVVAATGSYKVCPTVTTTYTLSGVNQSGSQQKQIMLIVSEPADTTPPPIPTPYVPQNGLTFGCVSSQNLVWLPVTDPSGIDGYFVQLEYEVSANNYQLVQEYGPIFDKQIEVDINCGLKYRWSVRARDGAGNLSGWSEWSTFSVNLN